MGRTRARSRSPRASCLARTIPSTTGFTHSRWLGSGATMTLSASPVSAWCVPAAPRWYFTSPDPCVELGSTLPSNSEKIWASGLPIVLASTFRRPRWDMPITDSRTPARAASERTLSRRGIAVSPPSSEKRLWPMYFAWRKRSKLSASTSFSRTRRRPAASNWVRLRDDSIRSCSHSLRSGSAMYMYSTPIVPQYVSRRTSRISRSVARSRPDRPLVKNSRSRSHSVRP